MPVFGANISASNFPHIVLQVSSDSLWVPSYFGTYHVVDHDLHEVEITSLYFTLQSPAPSTVPSAMMKVCQGMLSWTGEILHGFTPIWMAIGGQWLLEEKESVFFPQEKALV